MEEIIALAAFLCGEETADDILAALCQAAAESLSRKLLDGVKPGDCGKAFPLAAAAIAAKARQEGQSSVAGFTAGALSLSVTEEGDRFTSAALALLEPWMKDSEFGFRRV